MNTKALWSAAILGTVAAFFSACGDGDSTKIKICNAKQITCLTAQGGEICSADGTASLPFDCGSGQHCCDPRVKGSECGDDVAAASCVGDCTPGTYECGSIGVSLRCSDDGRRWIPTDCPVGTGCDNDASNRDTYGTCVHNDETESVIVCDEGDATCADENTAKSCEQDGSGWVYTACPQNELCDEGACVLDPTKGCVPHSGTCIDKTHVKLCNDLGDAYEDTIECPNDTTCEDGACQGPVCPVGAIRCDDMRVGAGFMNAIASGNYQPQTVYACNEDGTAWEVSTCASNELCIYDNISANTVNTFIQELLAAKNRTDGVSGAFPTLVIPTSSRASCATPECAAPFALRDLYGNDYVGANRNTAGSFTCGDGRDPTSDPLSSYSLCAGLPPFNNLYWANYTCPELEQCVYEGSLPNVEESFSHITGPTCASDCNPGSTACFNSGNGTVGSVSSTGESTVTCAEDGTWDYESVTKCLSEHRNAREFWCAPTLQGTDSSFNIGSCMEPACATWFSVYDTFTLPEDVGACGTDGLFYPCKADGTFGEAEECSDCQLATGFAQISTLPETFAGYDPGTCSKCTNGEQRCIFSNVGANAGSPYYQVCADGVWGTRSCSDGKLCTQYVHPSTNLGSIICGAGCAPYTATCGGTDGKQIQTCNADGQASEFEDCATGACHVYSVASSSGGSAYCEAECIAGTASCSGGAEVTCTSKGRYDVLNPTLCDVSNLQNPETCVEKLGCVECDPGTFSGRPAVRCAVDENGAAVVPPAVQVCKGGTWDDAIDCPGIGTACLAGVCTFVSDGGEGGAGGGGPGNAGASGEGQSSNQ